MAKAMKKTVKVMKKSAMKKAKVIEEEEDDHEEESSEEQDEAEASSSEEEEASGSSEEGSDDEEEEDDEESSSEEDDEKPKAVGPSTRQQANAAKSVVNRCQRTISKLENKQADLATRMKENKDAIRKVEKEMEAAKAIYSNKKRAFNRVQNEKQRLLDERKANTAARFRKANNKRVKAAEKRLAAVSGRIRGVKGKAEDAKAALNRAQSKVDEATQLCKTLKAKGERIPEDLKDDYSSPFAYKPPGYMAAKQLFQAKEVLAKAQVVYKKAGGEFEVKDTKRKAALEVLEHIKNRKKGVNTPAAICEVATPLRTTKVAAKKTKKKARSSR